MNGGAVESALALVKILDNLGIPYMVGGSMACIVWGEPRFTQDVDFVVALKPIHVAPFVFALGEDWYWDQSTIEDAIRLRSSFNLIHLGQMVKVDVFVPEESSFNASKWTRVLQAPLVDSGQELGITSPEDILLQKLIWFRKGGEVSEQQWRDVKSLIRVRGEQLDYAYLDHWAHQLDLQDLLLRAQGEE